ncbi:MAG: FAD-binding oxidoreductase [Cyclobacteriaceae bacterium]
MSAPKKVDYLIVGQGLAGSVLSFNLLKRGKSIIVIDDNQPNTSSKVAAGLYNPITGRKMIKTWMADTLFPLIEPFYNELQKWCDEPVLNPIGIYRPFVDNAEQNEWSAKAEDSEYKSFVKQVHTKSFLKGAFDDFGGLSLQPSGYVDVACLLNGVAKKLETADCLCRETFEEKHLILGDNQVEYRGIKAPRIVFCTGLGSISFFEWLPFRPVKGEVLEIKSDIELNTILNRGVFIIPRGRDRYKLGATYNWKDLTINVSKKGKENLISKFQALINGSVEVVAEDAGIRPATPDRRPLIGSHPDDNRLVCFNGLGSKGVSLAPYFSGHLIDHLEKGIDLMPEVNISRYY